MKYILGALVGAGAGFGLVIITGMVIGALTHMAPHGDGGPEVGAFFGTLIFGVGFGIPAALIGLVVGIVVVALRSKKATG